MNALLDLLQKENDSPSEHSDLIFSTAWAVLSALPDDAVCPARVLCLARIALYHQTCARPEESLAPAESALSCARTLGDPNLIAKAAKILGVAHSYLGDFAGAVHAFTQALESAQIANDRGQQAANWNNLGLAHHSAGRYEEAVAMFEKAIAVAGDDPQFAKQRQLALSNIAFAALHAGDLRRGLAAGRRAARELPPPNTATDFLYAVNVESALAQLLIELDMVDEARQRSRLLRDYADRSQLRLVQINADYAEGIVEVASGNFDIGFTRIKRALEYARQELPASVRDGLLALIKAYQIAGKPDAALVYLRELLRLNEDATAERIAFNRVHRLRSAMRGRHTVVSTLRARQSGLIEQVSEKDLLQANVALLEQQSVAAELHDDATGEHCYRVGRLASLLARAYGVDDHTCFLIDLAARMHDIGKLTVPIAILLKPGKLTEDERVLMQSHTTAGAKILARANVPQMYVAEEIARHHHERWDGTGYPAALRGSAIPLAARIAALSDVYDALTHVRPYKRAWTPDEALAEIHAQRGKHFDPELTDVFLRLMSELRAKHSDLDAFLAAEARSNPFLASRAKIARALRDNEAPGLHIEDPRR
ncbi:MAG TPA: HD domain-containing phosphohydrolase [Burkholderiaceae bacterium]|nr:HD domain-containing phosphohydrolase [Burkholderiaceae bacterium]